MDENNVYEGIEDELLEMVLEMLDYFALPGYEEKASSLIFEYYRWINNTFTEKFYSYTSEIKKERKERIEIVREAIVKELEKSKYNNLNIFYWHAIKKAINTINRVMEKLTI